MSRKKLPTPDQDAEFDGYVKKWQTSLGLADWHIYRRESRAKGAMADVLADLPSRQAGYRTGSWGAGVIDSASMEETALHEMLHVLLHEMKNATEATMESAEHRAINVLTTLLLK